MCVSSVGEEFLEAIDTLGHIKDVVYMADVMKMYLTKIGLENVVQICNVRIVQEDWTHLYFQGCMAHALNLLLQDWDSPLWANSVVKDTQKIVKYI
jgi:hypothetical protein